MGSFAADSDKGLGATDRKRLGEADAASIGSGTYLILGDCWTAAFHANKCGAISVSTKLACPTFSDPGTNATLLDC